MPAPYARLAGSGRVDGFVLTDVARDDPRIAVLEDAGLPAVVAGHPGPGCPFPWIETEHGPGMAAAAGHLAARGHERIAFLGGEARLDYVATRREHWHAALAAAGLDPGPVVCAAPGEPPAATAARALATGATAVAATSDVLAVSLVAAGRAAGRRVPEDLAVTGFDDSPLAAHGVPPLTSVRVDYAEFGAAAADALLRVLDGGSPSPARSPRPSLSCARRASRRSVTAGTRCAARQPAWTPAGSRCSSGAGSGSDLPSRRLRCGRLTLTSCARK